MKKGCITCSREFGGDFSVCPHDGTRLTPLSQADLLGTVLDGRYEILDVLGGGGMGLVYKARHSYMKRTVAVKVLHKHNVASTDALKRFRLEAQAVSSLNAPNILTVYDFGVSSQGQPYMVMDYLEGTSLHDVLEAEHSLSIERSLNIFIQICSALEHAHEKNVIHRDLKPSNIMLVSVGDQKDFVKIVDFGIAKLLGAADGEMEQLTRTGEIFGSPLYMSPEQCRGKPLDCRTDIYSLGSVMYQTITGKPLFDGDEVLDLFFKQTTQSPAPFSVACPTLQIPQVLEQTILRTLEKEPDDRIQTMRELRLKLEAIRQSQMEPGQPQSAALAASEALPSKPQVRTSAQFSPIITTDPGASPVNFQSAPPGTEAQILEQKFGKRMTIVIVACGILFLTLLALSFMLGRNEAIVEESKQHKDAVIEKSAVKERAQQESTASPILKQTLAPPAPIITPPTATLNSGGEKVSDQKKTSPADIGQKHAPPLQAHTAAQKTRKILRPGDRTVAARQPQQSDREATVTEPPVAPPTVNRSSSSTSVSSPAGPDSGAQAPSSASGVDQQTVYTERHSTSSKLWTKFKRDEGVRHSIFKKAVRIIKDSLSE